MFLVVFFIDSYSYHMLILLILQIVVLYISQGGLSRIGKDPFLVLPCLVDTYLTALIK